MVDPIRQNLMNALAWGATYGPKIAHSDWDEMRDKMVDQFLDDIRNKTKWHSLVEAASDVIFWDGDARATTAFKVLEAYVIKHSHIPEIVAIRTPQPPCSSYHSLMLHGVCQDCGYPERVHAK